MAALVVVTPAEFRQAFPEFKSLSKYPDGQVQFWIDWATRLINPLRFRDMTASAIQLYTAHNLFLQRTAENAANKGGVPGANMGVLNNKSVGPVSAGYDASAGTIDGIGDFNLTTYGVRLYNLIRMFGAGPIQVW